MGSLNDYALQGQYSNQQQAMQLAMQQYQYANSNVYALQQYDVTAYGLAGATLKASPLARDPVPSTSVKQSNEAWLDERVNEMRVKL